MRQGCQIVCFQTKNTHLGKFWRALELKMLAYFMTILNIYGHLAQFMAVWNLECVVCGHLVHFSRFGMFGPRKIWQL
jgi:hypothetical protein